MRNRIFGSPDLPITRRYGKKCRSVSRGSLVPSDSIRPHMSSTHARAAIGTMLQHANARNPFTQRIPSRIIIGAEALSRLARLFSRSWCFVIRLVRPGDSCVVASSSEDRRTVSSLAASIGSKVFSLRRSNYLRVRSSSRPCK